MPQPQARAIKIPLILPKINPFFFIFIFLFLSLILFFIFTRVTFFDELIVNVANIFVGSLQDTLGVSSSANSLREIFMDYIPKLAQTSDPALSAAISSNAGYLLALVNFAFNVVFSYVCLIIFGILKLILYLTYVFFYSEKKYKKNVELRFKRKQTKIPYILACSIFL